MAKDKSESNGPIRVIVPDTLDEAMEPLERSFGDLVQSLLPELQAKLDLLLEEQGIKEVSPVHYGVVALLSSGVSYRQTAELLDISKTTVWRVGGPNSRFAPIIKELREVYARKIFQWAMSLVPWSFRAMFDNLTKGNLDQRRLAAQAIFKLVADQLTSGSSPPAAEFPLPPAEDGVMDIFD